MEGFSLPTETELLITGVGIPAALYRLQESLYAKKYDFVIQAGIAGAFNPRFKTGDVVLVKQDAWGDLGMDEQEEFIPLHESGLADKNQHPYQNGWLVNNDPFLDRLDYPKTNAVTVSKVTGNTETLGRMNRVFNPDIESMEGAALHYVCLMNNIPFLQVRSISNMAGDRDKANWNFRDALSNLHQETERIIQSIKQP